MHNALPALLSAILFTGAARAQWCVPTTAIPYAATMPGITHVVINTIDRTSADIENYPNNSYVNTGLSTTLVLGATYPVQISFTLDAPIAPHMNVRIWIDLNHDGQLDDPGETLVSADHQAGPTFTAALTVPTTAMTGPTRMRVTAKMCSHGGHILPTPCDMPADPLGYHGELEDYDVTITNDVGIGAPTISRFTLGLAPVPTDAGSMVEVGTALPGPAVLRVMDAAGREVASVRCALGTGLERMPFARFGALAPGSYVLSLEQNGQARSLPFVHSGR